LYSYFTKNKKKHLLTVGKKQGTFAFGFSSASFALAYFAQAKAREQGSELLYRTA
jgi:hypothetical protein